MVQSTSLVALLFLFTVACQTKSLEYPKTRTVDHVDTYHGTEVKDPYRWLEDDNADETKAWVEAQNKVTFGYLKKIKARGKIRERIKELWNYKKYGVPSQEGGNYFYTINDGLQNQSVLFLSKGLKGKRRVLLDPNKLSKDGTTALRGRWVSRNGKYMAYALSVAGSDWRTIRVMDIGSGKNLAADVLEHVKFSGASWTADSAGFYYSRFPDPGEGKALTAQNMNQRVYYHRIGTPQSEDALVYERPKEPKLGLGSWVTRDGSYLVLFASGSTGSKDEISVRNLDNDGPVTRLIEGGKNNNIMLGNKGSTFYVQTDRDAPKLRIVAIDLDNPDPRSWAELVPETKDVIKDAAIIGGHFVLHYLKRASSRLVLHTMDGKFAREIELPTLGSLVRLRGEPDHNEMFFAFTSFTYPTTVMRYDFRTKKLSAVQPAEVEVDPDDYVVKQVVYKSRDGQSVTMFIAHKKSGDFKLDGSHPTLLYGYGGFNIPVTPWFSVSQLVWMDMGGVFAVANLRGGGEYGEEWHEAGMRENKQTVFDDFIAAAESLIAKGYTSRSKLAIQGGSNGGLLVGACMIQRPDLFAVCLPAVGVMDMLRFHKFTIGRFWVGEYGSSDDPDMFRVLRAYSPYHTLEKGVRYPATMVTTADHDDRVVPAHSFKFAARLQACQAGPAPVLIRIEVSGGHGAGTPTSKRIDAVADRYAFLAENLRMKLPSRYR